MLIVRLYSIFAIAQLGTSDLGISAISDVTERDGFEFADVISDVIHRRDASMDSHHVQLWFEAFGRIFNFRTLLASISIWLTYM